MTDIIQQVALKLSLRLQHVQEVAALLDEGATIPFIARYRKDRTGAMDEVQIQQVQDEIKMLKEFTERKLFIEKTITEQGNMTELLQQKINGATTISELEDIYLPYKPKRKTKAQTAKENGLEPLASLILQQTNSDLHKEAQGFFNEKITTAEEALQGARDIIAEAINEDATVRAAMRKLFEDTALVKTKITEGKEAEAAKYRDYFEFSEPVKKIPSHRILAVLRGFMEGFLKLSIEPTEEDALYLLEKNYIKGMSESGIQVKKAIKDAYKRLLQPAMETECRTALKQNADEDAIQVFAENLKQLLLSAPLGSKKILAIDPGYRSGCKIVCLDEKGSLLHTAIIYIHESNRIADAEDITRKLVQQYAVEVIAIGDGTAGRETEKFIKGLNLGVQLFLVNEDGASVYSASEAAREEFPDKDITVRGAVSIGRRLMDPLAELVKIDPKSIGVGQYQHDVNQARLKEKLDQTVISCVNAVGVNLNTASKHLLSYVSGIGPAIAANIINYRNETGVFKNRNQLLKVTRLGGKAYEQCAGFLRIKESANPLDASAVHPETYSIVEQMAADVKADVKTLIGNNELISKIQIEKYISDQFGKHTIQDILNELRKPGLDPRSSMEQFEFADIYAIEDVKEGMIVPGVVTNITRFGAFVDIGVKQDGLVHVSEIAHKYIADPAEVLQLNHKVRVKVMEVDIARKRIQLSIKQATEYKREPNQIHVKPKKKEENIEAMNVTDALAALKKKFAK